LKLDNKIYVKGNKKINLLFVKFQDLTPGFTLVELAIVLVIVGLLIGMGAGLLGPLTKRTKLIETRNTVKEVYETINGYAAANKQLPPGLIALSAKTLDSYKNILQYYFATGLTTSNLCTTRPPGGIYLTVNDIGVTKTNVAFIVFSRGENLCDQTGAGSPFNIYNPGVQTACIAGGGNRDYDDIVMYADISTLRQQICNTFMVVTDSLPTGTEEVAYAESNLNATDGATPYTWSILSGSLPGGLILQNRTSGTCGSTSCTVANPCGCISGTPILDGSYNFIVSVTDAEARTATKSLSITINPNDPRITTEFLHYGSAGNPYNATLAANGGTGSYTWSLIIALPPNLILNSGTGAISGSPAATGTYPFEVQITDTRGRQASKWLSIAVN
jgi:prepilin-type N-terminal cleavage/methylation domain-containing protein